MVAMAMLASPGFHALRLHSTAKTTCRSLPHKSIPFFARGRTGTYDACDATTPNTIYLSYCAIVAGLRSRHPRNVAASRPRAPLTLRLEAKPIYAEVRVLVLLLRSTTGNRIGGNDDSQIGYKTRKKRTPTRLTFYYSHPLRPAPSSRATTFRGNCRD